MLRKHLVTYNILDIYYLCLIPFYSYSVEPPDLGPAVVAVDPDRVLDPAGVGGVAVHPCVDIVAVIVEPLQLHVAVRELDPDRDDTGGGRPVDGGSSAQRVPTERPRFGGTGTTLRSP